MYLDAYIHLNCLCRYLHQTPFPLQSNIILLVVANVTIILSSKI